MRETQLLALLLPQKLSQPSFAVWARPSSGPPFSAPESVFGQRDDRLGDAGSRCLFDQRNAVVAHFDHHAIVVGQLPEDVPPDRLLGLLQTDVAVVQSDAIDHDVDLLLQAVDGFERHHQPHDVAQAGQIQLRDQQDLLGGLQGRHVDAIVGSWTGR